jgi:hypothetical protein
MVLTLDPDGQDRIHVSETEFFNEIMHDVYGPRQGGAIIFVDAENARKGVAKTSGAVALARLFATAFEYELSAEDFLIAGPNYVRRYREHPGRKQPSVVVADELVGGGAGDSRRWMTSENINIGRAFQLLRKKRVITLTTLPDWNDADSRLQKQAAYRVHCLERPIGKFRAYKINTSFDDKGDGLLTKGLGPGSPPREINFPDMDRHDDPFFALLEEKKDELLDTAGFEAATMQEDDEEVEEQLTEDEVRREERVETAIRLYQPWNEETDHSYEEVARTIPEFGREWVGQRVREWKRGEHRDLVEDPTA